jgi:hypothetical protein
MAPDRIVIVAFLEPSGQQYGDDQTADGEQGLLSHQAIGANASKNLIGRLATGGDSQPRRPGSSGAMPKHL